jgi:hypothetical protein
MNEETKKKYRSPALALGIAFLPAAMLLGLFTLERKVQPEHLQAACIISVLCCFVSSFMLFARLTVLAILAGLFFLLLNAAIAFFFGCAASFRI